MTIRKVFAGLALVLLCAFPAFAAEYSVRTTDELTRAIASSQPGDTINLAAGRYILSSTLELNKAVTLKSPAGAVIDGNNACRVIHIAGDVVLDGLTITGGNDTSNQGGGGVYVSAGSSTIENCIITGNKTTTYGGGIKVYDKEVKTDIINCSITNNQAKNGGGLYCSYSHVNVTNSRISGNIATTLSGGFFSDYASSLNLTNCTIADNQAGAEGGGGYAGISTNNTLINCTITGNKCGEKGGGLLCAISSMKVINCTITGNSAPEGSGVVNGFGMNLRNTIIRDDVYSISRLYSTNCAFPSGHTQGTNPVPLDWENPIPSTVEIAGVTHTVYTVEDNPELLDLAYKGTNEDAPSVDQLGRLRAEHPAIGAVEILGNYTITTEEALVKAINNAGTGAIITLADGTYTLSGTLTINQAITLQGSGNTVLQGSGSSRVLDIYADAKICNLTISGGRDNESRNGGGAIRVSSGHPTIKNCTITGCRAQNGGGIAVLNSSSAEIIGCTITGNNASSMGGGIVVIGSTANITNCTITSNKSYDGGGGVCVSNGSAEITNCNISGNSEGNCGGVWVRYNSKATITNCTIADNKTRGVYVYYRSTAELVNCTITGNESASGGGVYASNGTATLTNCTITGNKADSGSCVFVYSKGTANLINSLIWDANASKAAYCGASSTLNFTNCALPANFTGGSGKVNNVSAVTLASWANPVSSSVRISGVAHTVFAPSVNPELSLLKAAGTSENAPANDQLGNKRDNRPTIGAVESGTAVAPSSVEVSLHGNYALTMTEGESRSLNITPEVTAVYSDGRREILLPADYSITWSVQEDMLSLYAMSFSNGTLSVSSGTAAGSYNVTVRANVQVDDLTAATSRKLAITVKPASGSDDPNQGGRGSSGEGSDSSNVAISVEGSEVVMTISGADGSSGKTFADYIAGRDPEEIARVTTLSISGRVENISGLGAFTSLKALYAQDCEGLREVDASDCATLETLYIPSCDITALNVEGCTSLNALVCSNNQITSLNLETCTALQAVDCSGQKVSRQMTFSGGAYSVYIGLFDPERIHSLAAYDAGGSEINASYDAESGVVVCTNLPARITYGVATGFSDADMDVTVYPAGEDSGNTTSTSGSSSGCNGGFGLLAVFAAVWFARKK